MYTTATPRCAICPGDLADHLGVDPDRRPRRTPHRRVSAPPDAAADGGWPLASNVGCRELVYASYRSPTGGDTLRLPTKDPQKQGRDGPAAYQGRWPHPAPQACQWRQPLVRRTGETVRTAGSRPVRAGSIARSNQLGLADLEAEELVTATGLLMTARTSSLVHARTLPTSHEVIEEGVDATLDDLRDGAIGIGLPSRAVLLGDRRSDSKYIGAVRPRE